MTLDKQFSKIVRPDLVNTKHKWFSVDSSENYYNLVKKINLPYGPEDIRYEFNNYGFRCDDFEDCRKFPYRILFAGCSMTEGVGLPLEHTWAKLIHQKICNKFGIEMPFWSVASAGAGFDQLVRYVYNLKDILRPHIIISYLPSRVRRERWFEDRWSHWDLELPVHKELRDLLDTRFVTYQTEKNIVLLEYLLKELNCYFLFSSSMDDFEISDYSNSPYFIQRPHIPEQFDIARDGLHAGPETNKIMADRVFNDFSPIIEKLLDLTNKK